MKDERKTGKKKQSNLFQILKYQKKLQLAQKCFELLDNFEAEKRLPSLTNAM